MTNPAPKSSNPALRVVVARKYGKADENGHKKSTTTRIGRAYRHTNGQGINILLDSTPVLTGNARTRLPFPGVGALYRALTRDGEARNPIFYVSSSPWNFFDLLWQFLDYRRIPLGPMFLRNWGVDLLGGHGGYKHGVIERIFTRFPDLTFVLVGDSGEKDPEIYAEIVRRHPGRVLAVYIRDVTEGTRDSGVLKLREEVRKTGADLVLAADSLNAASHAMAMGLITPGEYRSVLTSVARTYET